MTHSRDILRIRLSLWCSAVAIACALGGCDGDALAVNPAPVLSSPPADAGLDAVPDAPGSDAPADPDTGPVIREVLRRDPWGPLDPSNMLHDGDFELSGLNAIQYPWLGIEQSYIRTGATCRSGLRCLEMPQGHYVMGMFVWPDAPMAEVSFYGRPSSSQNCESEALGLVTVADMYNGPETWIGAETPEPVDGWCRYAQTIPVPQNPGYHYWVFLIATSGEATGPVAFDGASIKGRMDGTLPRSLSPLPAKHAALVARAKQRAKELLPPNPPHQPTPVKNPTGKRGNHGQ